MVDLTQRLEETPIVQFEDHDGALQKIEGNHIQYKGRKLSLSDSLVFDATGNTLRGSTDDAYDGEESQSLKNILHTIRELDDYVPAIITFTITARCYYASNPDAHEHEQVDVWMPYDKFEEIL